MQPEPPPTPEEIERPPQIDVQGTVALFASSNMIDALAASIFVLVAVSLLAHRLLWPLIQRPLYALQAAGFIGRRKLLFSVGGLLLGYSLGVNLDLLKEMFRSFMS